MSSFILKIIAIFSMLCDHSGYILFKKITFMNCIGRLAFPIFAFQLTEGYLHTKNRPRYCLRLFIFALFSQPPYMLFLSTFTNKIFSFNILFTLCLGLLTIILFDKTHNYFLKALIIFVSCSIAQLLHFDYGWYGIVTIIIFHCFKNNKLLFNLLFSYLVLVKYSINYLNTRHNIYIFLALCVLLSLLPINLYNGKKGKSTKYLFYVFYPLHLIILYIISLILK